MILLGEWGFLDNLQDTSGNGRTATFTSGGGTLTYANGPTAGTRAVAFNNDNDCIDYGRAGLEPTADGVTTMAWAKMVGAPGVQQYYGILTKARQAASSRSRFGIRANKNTAFAVRWKNDLAVNDDFPAGINDDIWHHHAVVDGNTGWAYYIDGVVKASGTRSFDNTTSPTWEAFNWKSGRDTTLGDHYAGTNLSVSGARIFQGQLTQAEVLAWMNTPIMAAQPPGSGVASGSYGWVATAAAGKSSPQGVASGSYGWVASAAAGESAEEPPDVAAGFTTPHTVGHRKYMGTLSSAGYPGAPTFIPPDSQPPNEYPSYGWYPLASEVPLGDNDYTMRVIRSQAVGVPDVSLYEPGDLVILDGEDYVVSEDVRDFTNGPFGRGPGGVVIVERVTG